MSKPNDFEEVREIIAENPNGAFYCDTDPSPRGYFGIEPNLSLVESTSIKDYMTDEEGEKYDLAIAPLQQNADKIMEEENRRIDEGISFDDLSVLEDELRATWKGITRLGLNIIIGAKSP